MSESPNSASTTVYYLYSFSIPLRYNSFTISSIEKDNEFVSGLDNDLLWTNRNIVKDDGVYEQEILKQYPQFICRLTNVYHSDSGGSTSSSVGSTALPEADATAESQEKEDDADNYQAYELVNEYQLKVENLVAAKESNALDILQTEITVVCNALSLALAKYNCNKQLFQPRVEPVWESRTVEKKKIVPESQKSRSYIDGNGNIVYEIRADIACSVSCFTKIYGKFPSEEISAMLKPHNPHYQYVMQEYCAALGTEGIRSKYFHLFCIIEFIEREYVGLAGAERLLNDEQVKTLDKAFKEILKSTELDKTDQAHVAPGLKGCMMKMTTDGRAQKLVNILHAMGIDRIEDGGIKFDVNKERMNRHINTRNTLFHGNDTDKELHELVTELMCLDIKVLEYLENC